MLKEHEIVEKWLQAFAMEVPRKIIKNHVTASGNFLWHIFGWGKADCFQGDEARNILDSISSKEKCILFHNGFSVNGKNKIEDLSRCVKLSSIQMDELQQKQPFSKKDIHLVEQNFEWSYIITHESDCGPYFCYRSK